MTVVLNGLAAAMILVIPLFGYKEIFLVAIAFGERRRRTARVHVRGHRAIRNGLRLRPALDLRDEQLRAVGKLCVATARRPGLNPVARLGEQLIVSFLPTGSTEGAGVVLGLVGVVVMNAAGEAAGRAPPVRRSGFSRPWGGLLDSS